jgi:hypothetical protein
MIYQCCRIGSIGDRVAFASQQIAQLGRQFAVKLNFAGSCRYVDGVRHEFLSWYREPRADKDPDRLSFLHAVRVVRRKMAAFGAIPPRGRKEFHNAVLNEILDESAASSRNPRGVKRKMTNFPLRRGYKRSRLRDISAAIRIVK